MSVNNNILTSIGDRLFLNSQIGVFGNLNITSISENVIGETINRFFIKKFKWSKDNLTWSDWEDLNLTNVQSLNGNYFDVLFLSFYFERAGSDENGFLKFIDLEFSGNLVIHLNDYSTTNASIFKGLLDNNSLTVSIANNLLKKVYKRGILPTFMERGVDDSDFVSFWSSVCTFCSLLVALANRFDNILNDKEFLSEYLSQRGFKFSKEEITIQELQYISNNFLDEMRQRGTISILLEKGHVYRDESIKEIDGEWLRALAKNHYDEFLVEFIKKEDCGYFMDNSSPTYNGTNLSTQLNKTQENTVDFVDKTKFPFLNPAADYYEIDTDGENSFLRLTPGIYEESTVSGEFGIGFNPVPLEVDPKYLYKVDSEIDYEFTFMIKRQSTVGQANKLKLGVLGFNLNNFSIGEPFLQLYANYPTNVFYEDYFNKRFTTDEWYFVRCIIHAKNSWALENYIATGQSARPSGVEFGKSRLRFNHNEKVHKVLPFIQLIGENNNEQALIKDFKFRPLIRGKNVLPLRIKTSEGFINTPPYICNPSFVQNDTAVLSWTKNNSVENDKSVENFVNEYLLPYQKNLFNIALSPKTDDKQLLT